MLVEIMSQSSFGSVVLMLVTAVVLSVTLALFPWTAGKARADAQVPQSREQIQLSYAPVVKRVAPAVVNVYARRVVKERASPLFNDPFFQRFFGGQVPGGPSRERVAQSLGSGVIVSKDGLIVTNNHVIDGAQQLTIALTDRREFDAKVVLADKRTDLAVLKIDTKGKDLPYLKFRDSDTLEVGDLVLAVGNPFGVGQTVTTGIVSALARTHVGVSDYQFFIQTDAAINPGNSGGALVTMDGKLAGINTAIFSQSGGSVGIGFAIPANMVRLIVDGARDGGHIKRPWLGAQLQAVDKEMAGSLGLDRSGGGIIRDIYPNGPAAKAGLKVGDVIRAVDGHDVIDPAAVRYRFATKGLGGKADVSYMRDGDVHTARVMLVAPPEDPPAHETSIDGRNPFSGMRVANLSPAIADRLGLSVMGGQGGVVVLDVEQGSPASRIKFQRGDVILEVNRRKIERVKDLTGLVGTSRAQWDFSVRRGDRVFSATVSG
ncbi:DegQ family serine endoprotease [Parvibaculum sp. MBR-TMA-1.3b-4.2]|jgi:serine protease Do